MRNTKRTVIITSSIIAAIIIILAVGTFALSQRDYYAKATNIQQYNMANGKINSLDFPQLDSQTTSDETLVKVETTAGDFQIKLFPKYAPLAVQNFAQHAKDGYYNGTEFFRIIKGFMIQGGDPKNDGTGGQSIWKGNNTTIDSGSGFKNEISPNLYNLNGAISMANTGQANTNGSQFFINVNSTDATKNIPVKQTYPTKIYNAYKNGGNPNLDGGYTVFGQVISGMDIVTNINNAELAQSSSSSDATTSTQNTTPKNPVKITKIDILQEAK